MFGRELMLDFRPRPSKSTSFSAQLGHISQQNAQWSWQADHSKHSMQHSDKLHLSGRRRPCHIPRADSSWSRRGPAIAGLRVVVSPSPESSSTLVRAQQRQSLSKKYVVACLCAGAGTDILAHEALSGVGLSYNCGLNLFLSTVTRGISRSRGVRS